MIQGLLEGLAVTLSLDEVHPMLAMCLIFFLISLCLQESESQWQTRLAQMTLNLEQKDAELRQTVTQTKMLQDKLTQLQVSVLKINSCQLWSVGVTQCTMYEVP